MSAGRSSRITLLVAEEAAKRRAKVGVVDVCAAAVAALPISGAGLSAMSRTAPGHPLCSTDEVSERLEELQLTLGEGPCVDAFTLGLAVLAPDLRTAEMRARWPVFTVAAIDAGAAAVFALPLQIGAISSGALDLYADTPVELDAEHLADALAFADCATLVLLDTRIEESAGVRGGPLRHGRREDLGRYRAEIDQASGMLTVQLGVGIEEAFVRLRAYSYAHGRRLADVAADVVGRRLRFEPDPPPGPNTPAGPSTPPGPNSHPAFDPPLGADVPPERAPHAVTGSQEGPESTPDATPEGIHDES
ncbi:ANTAR domain-containing protein [Streptomyces sp. NPDC058371]|uniref:ANTAR domain-containing protein n=1 Tax=Streptomyces sp. NPDC058371 TaxID=3346463 RepID=UPI00365285FB